MNTLEAIRDLASLQAETIRRMGAAYGSAEDWRRDITTAVKITEQACVAIAERAQAEAIAARIGAQVKP